MQLYSYLAFDDWSQGSREWMMQFQAVGVLQRNEWLKEFDISDIGGVVGLASNYTGLSQPFLTNATSNADVFSLQLAGDWGWLGYTSTA